MPSTMIYPNKQALIAATITPSDTVLDIGFLGQGKTPADSHWLHRTIKKIAKETYGLDLQTYETNLPQDEGRYFKQSAEHFTLPVTFDVIFAGDLIEHLSNPGLFLDACKKHLKPNGRLILTTPNTFNLFNIAEKLTKDEPTVNSDHTCYFNKKTINVLLRKNGWTTTSFDTVYSLELSHQESLKKKFLNILYRGLSRLTEKYIETLVITAVPEVNSDSSLR
ncbi:MAG: methyltransferase domain-containing protein [Candidatus Nomurabacteria bacterium]|nr:MAG: methyltransferase domain-containing protein [Candidatus Nomurabacteria bacterium]